MLLRLPDPLRSGSQAVHGRPHGGQGLPIQAIGFRPGPAQQGRLAQADQLGGDLVDRQARRAHVVGRLDVPVELRAEFLKLVGLDLPVPGRGRPGEVQGLLELAHDVGLVGLVGVQFQAERGQPDGPQAPEDDLQGRALLRDEEDRAPVGQRVGDQVGDRLGLAGSGRALQDEAVPLLGREHGGQLGRVGIQGAEDLARRSLVHLARGHELDGGQGGGAGFDQMTDGRIPHELVLASRQVQPHQELGEREVAQVGFLHHLPAGHLQDRPSEGVEDPGDVQAGLVLGEFVQGGDLDAEVPLHLLQQGGVQPGLVLGQPDPEGLGHRSAHDLHRQQQDGRPARRGRRRRLEPLQESQGQVQGIGPRLLEVGARLAEHLDQPFGEVGGGQVGIEPAGLHLPGQELAFQVLAGLLLVQLQVARLASPIRARQDLEGHLAGQAILHDGQVGAEQRDALRPGPIVQQAVAQREVQKLAAPSFQAALGDLPGAARSLAGGSSPQGGRRQGGGWSRGGLGLGQDEASSGLEPDRQGSDPGVPGRLDVHGVFEGLDLAEGLAGHLLGLFKAHPRPAGRRRRVEEGHLAHLGPLAKRKRIVPDRLGQAALLQPDPGEGVPLDQDQHGVQPCLLHGGGHQERQVQAVAHPGFQELVGGPDLLAALLEAGGQAHVGDVQVGNGAEDRRRLQARAVGVPALVALEGGVSRPALEVLAGLAEQGLHRRMVGHDEGRQGFGKRSRAAPLVVGQQFQGVGLAQQDLPPRGDLQAQPTGLALDEIGQSLGREREVRDPDVPGRLPLQAGQSPLPARAQIRLGPDRQGQLLQGLRVGIFQAQFVHHRHGVLLQGQVDPRVVGQMPHEVPRRGSGHQIAHEIPSSPPPGCTRGSPESATGRGIRRQIQGSPGDLTRRPQDAEAGESRGPQRNGDGAPRPPA